MPAASAVWWRAQIRAREEAARRGAPPAADRPGRGDDLRRPRRHRAGADRLHRHPRGARRDRRHRMAGAAARRQLLVAARRRRLHHAAAASPPASGWWWRRWWSIWRSTSRGSRPIAKLQAPNPKPPGLPTPNFASPDHRAETGDRLVGFPVELASGTEFLGFGLGSALGFGAWSLGFDATSPA